MCFSAAASFTTGTILLPLGVYCITKTSQFDRNLLIFATFPLVFALQQFIEGFVWLNYEIGDSTAMYSYALGFLFFSHFLWLVLTPLAAWQAEPEGNSSNKRYFTYFTMAGFLYGLFIYLPPYFDLERLNIVFIEHSIYYETFLIFHETVSRHVARLIYAIIIVVPLLMSTHWLLRRFALWLAVSVIATLLFFEYAFISVWCFFSAILSVDIARQMMLLERKTAKI